MTIDQLNERVTELEQQVAQLQRDLKTFAPLSNIQQTFGMFADDPDFDEIVKLGREYRQQVNAEEP